MKLTLHQKSCDEANPHFSEFKDKETIGGCDSNNTCPYPTGQSVIQSFGFISQHYVWRDVGGSCVLILGFRALAYCGLVLAARRAN